MSAALPSAPPKNPQIFHIVWTAVQSPQNSIFSISLYYSTEPHKILHFIKCIETTKKKYLKNIPYFLGKVIYFWFSNILSTFCHIFALFGAFRLDFASGASSKKIFRWGPKILPIFYYWKPTFFKYFVSYFLRFEERRSPPALPDFSERRSRSRSLFFFRAPLALALAILRAPLSNTLEISN